MLKAQRERQRLRQLQEGNYEANAQDAIIGTRVYRDDDNDDNDDDDDAWLEAFQSAKNEMKDTTPPELEFDGYALRDMLVAKWGVPLDVDFQSMSTIGTSTGTSFLYCTVLPLVGYGSPLRSRHDSELEYLMHLQGVVEVLCKYNNLEGFLAFVEGTDRVPKPGTDSVPFRLDLSEEDLEGIMLFKNGVANP